MQKIVEIVLGKAWKSTLLGLALGVATAVTAFAQGKSEPGWYLVAIGFAALGRAINEWKSKAEAEPAP